MTAIEDIKEALRPLYSGAIACLLEGHIRLSDQRTQTMTRTWAKFVEIKRGWNSLLPIHKLPAEILTIILLDVNGSSYCPGTMERNHVLAQVCRGWTDLILNSPLFWRRISYDVAKAVHIGVWKSGSGKVNVICDLSASWTNRLAEEHFFKQTLALAGRVSTLSLTGTLEARQRRYIESMTRYVTNLTLASTLKHVVLSQRRIVHLHAARPVEDLVAHRVTINWGRTIFNNLQSMVLYDLWSLPSTPQLQAIVSVCRNLEQLVFVGCLDLDEANGGTPEDGCLLDYLPVVDSPRLRRLIFENVPERIRSFFLYHVTADACRHLHAAHCYGERLSTVWTSPSLKSLIGAPLQDRAISDITVTIIGRDDEVTIKDPVYPHLDLRWFFDEETLREVHQYSGLFFQAGLDLEERGSVIKMVEFLNELPRQVSNISFGNSRSDIPPDSLPANIDVLDRLASVTHITIGDGFLFPPLLEYIAEDRKDFGVPFPHLTTLVFDVVSLGRITAEVVDDILHAIQKRNQFAMRRDTRISSITELYAGGRTMSTFKAHVGFRQAGVTLILLPER